jgi:hypothetical protein
MGELDPSRTPFCTRMRVLLNAVEAALPPCDRCDQRGFVAYPSSYPGGEDAAFAPDVAEGLSHRYVRCDEPGCPYVPLSEAAWLAGRAGAALAILYRYVQRWEGIALGDLRAAIDAAAGLVGSGGEGEVPDE